MLITTPAGATRAATRRMALFDDTARRLPEIARMRTGRSNFLFELQEYRALLDGCTDLRENHLHCSSGRRAKLVFHLHGFHDDKSLPRLHDVADLHRDAHNHPRHWRNEWRWAGRPSVSTAQFPNGTRALVEGFDVIA